MLVGIVTDNLHGVLVGTNCTIGTQTVELGLEHAFATYGDFGLLRQRSEGNVVYDTDSEWFFGVGSDRLSYTAKICAGVVSFEPRP